MILEIFDPVKGPTAGAPASDEDTSFTKGQIVRAIILESTASGQTRLKIGARLIMAVLSSQLETGREAALRVISSFPRLTFELLPENDPAIDSKAARFEGARAGEPSPAGTNVAPDSPLNRIHLNNQTLLARVLDKPAGNLVRLLILKAPSSLDPGELRTAGNILHEGREITARMIQDQNALKLTPGHEIRFTVARMFPQVVLKVADQPELNRAALNQALARFLGAPADLSEKASQFLKNLATLQDWPGRAARQFENLENLVRELSPRAGEPDLDFPARLFRLLGLSDQPGSIREAIGRLWAEMIAAPDLEQYRDDPFCRILLDSSTRLADSLEHMQILNQETIRQEQIFFSFPLFWPGGQGRGELKLDYPEGDPQTEGNRPFRITFLLFLSKLGRIKINVLLNKKLVSCLFYVENQTLEMKINRNLNRLTESLRARGFEVNNISARTFPSLERPPESLAEELLIPEQGLIDVRV